jgi:hypothetical protein
LKFSALILERLEVNSECSRIDTIGFEEQIKLSEVSLLSKHMVLF